MSARRRKQRGPKPTRRGRDAPHTPERRRTYNAGLVAAALLLGWCSASWGNSWVPAGGSRVTSPDCAYWTVTSSRCPCLSGESYDGCCGRLHRGEAVAVTAEQLMRSRFSAFAVGDPDYLRATWHPSTRPADLDLDPALRWYRLDVLAATDGGPFDRTGTVEFRAWYRHPDGNGDIHEVSRFTREDDGWLYAAAVG